MMNHGELPANAAFSERVLVLVDGADEARAAFDIIERDGLDGFLCADVDQLCLEMDRGMGAALLSEELVSRGVPPALTALLRAQPPWSSYPLVFVAGLEGPHVSARDLAELGSVTLLDRPLRAHSMLTSVHAALGNRRRQYEARRAIEGRDSFLAMLGHELRNPLGAISLAVKLLESKSPDGVLPREHRIIDRQLKNLTALVDDLLDVARVTHGKVLLKRERIELGEVVRAAFETLEARAREHRLIWKLEVEAPAAWVEGDRQRLEQVFGNLLVNAIKYTPPGGNVSVKVESESDGALVTVEDSGVGLSPEMCSRVFEPFTQAARSLDRSQGGLGLGLALVRSVVQMHGGSVHAESPGLSRGASFVVRLPAAGSNELQDRRDAPPRRVVVVEDNDDMRDLLTELLRAAGHQVTCASDGLGGLDMLLSSEPHIAFIDIGLPGIDGLELARRARRMGSQAWLVALSGYGEREDKHLSKAAGFDDHLVKPVANASLEQALRRITCSRPRTIDPSISK